MNTTFRKANELDRRSFLARTAQSMLGVGLLPVTEQMFSGKVFAAGEGSATAKQVPTARNVIMLYMTGGQSHLDTWDPKPKNKEVMGATKAIPTSADGVMISEYLPRTAKFMHHACVKGLLQITRAMADLPHPDRAFWTPDPVFAELIKNGRTFDDR